MSVSLYGSGQTVIQVVQGSNATVTSTTSATPVTTNVSASITPQSTSSKILAIVNISGAGKNGSSTTSAGYYLYRNGSSVFVSTDIAFYNDINAGNNFGNLSFAYLDAPATTSSTTYTVYVAAVGGGTAYSNDSNLVQANNTSTITLMEIAYA